MVIRNCEIGILNSLAKQNRFILWGAGEALKNALPHINKNEGSFLKEIDYIVDNKVNEFVYEGIKIPVYSPDRLKKEKKCVVLVSSTNFLIEIFEELKQFELPDSVDCYFLSFCKMEQPKGLIEKAGDWLKNSHTGEIPKLIHTFWFSGEALPGEYKKCLDSWRKYCPDYEIKIWDANMYDYESNVFAKEALKARKWAFVSDVARLDVLYKYGGIYMDLDIEIYRSLDELLHHHGVFFHCHDCVDLPVFASAKSNYILRKLRGKYDNVIFPLDENVLKDEFVQPRYIKSVFEEEGVPMEEGVHMVDNNLFLPRNLFLPDWWFDWSGKSKIGENGFGIHHCNAGWYSDMSRKKRDDAVKKVADIWDSTIFTIDI